MDPIASGAMKNVQGNLFEQAEQTIQKSNQQVSDFEKLRSKLEQQDAINPQQMDQIQKMNQTDPANKANQIDPTGQVQGVKDLQPGAGVPQIKNMDQLQGMVNDIRQGQGRLTQILQEATSGKTYSPSEMIAMQAEVGKITTQLDLATKVVENFVSGIKTTLNMQF